MIDLEFERVRREADALRVVLGAELEATPIAHAAYDDMSGVMTLVVRDGRVFEYDDVPPRLFMAFDATRAKGAFFDAEIRDYFHCREVTPPAPDNVVAFPRARTPQRLD